MQIDRTVDAGIRADDGTFNNAASIVIGSLAQIGANGIINEGTGGNIHNLAGGNIQISQTAQRAIWNRTGAITNAGSIENSGLIRLNTAGAHTNTGAVTNNGILVYAQNNTIPNVTNNEIIVAPKSTQCLPTLTNALGLGAPVNFTIAGNWYFNQNLTLPAGTFNTATNTFTASGFSNGTPQTVYFSINDAGNGRARTVSAEILFEDTTPPTITCPANNTAACTFTVTVADQTAPSITCPGPVTVTCAGNVPAVNLAAVTASDNCGAPTKSHVGDATSNQTCTNRKTITRTYRVTDASGSSITCLQVITVFDNVLPNFTFVPANVTVQCNSIPAVGTPMASDGCGGTVTIAYNGQTSAPGACPDASTITRQWTATDACGNTKTATQRITVIDSQKPNFVSVPANITVQCSAIPNPATPTATDNCDAVVAITYNGQTQTNGACANAYILTRTWTAADNCGNTRTISQRISVVDNGKPTLSVPANTAIACSDPIPSVGTPTASDGCAGAVTIAYLGQSTVSGACPGSYQIKRTWRATDACGNTTAATQTIQVSDNGAPVFVTVPGPVTIECNTPLPPLVNPTASDACGGYVHITFLGNVPTGSGCANSYTITRTWRAQDLCGNTATTTQVITVLGNNNFGAPEPEGIDRLRAMETRMPRIKYGFIQVNQPEEKPMEIRGSSVGSAFQSSTLGIQPNPTSDRIWLDLKDYAGEAVTVSIFNDLGQLVWENRIPEVADLKVSISLREAGAKAGIYTISVRSASGVAAKRVVLAD